MIATIHKLFLTFWLLCLVTIFVTTAEPPWGLPFWLVALLHGGMAAAVTVKIWERRA